MGFSSADFCKNFRFVGCCSWTRAAYLVEKPISKPGPDRLSAPLARPLSRSLPRGLGPTDIRTILDALDVHGLVEIESGEITISDLGKEFLAFMKENRLYRGILDR